MYMNACILGSVVVMGCLAASPAICEDRMVNVYNWSDYIDNSIINDFTKETGIKVIYNVYDSNEVLEAKLLAGRSGYDVVVPSHDFLARQIQAGVYQKLDKNRLPNLRYMWPEIMDRVAKYDPGNAYAVDYMWGTTGVGYNVDKIRNIIGTDKINSWNVLFDPDIVSKFRKCGVSILNSPQDVIPSVFAWLGVDPKSQDHANILKAEQVLSSVRPYVRQFDSENYISALANGDVCLVLGYSGDVLQAKKRAQEADNGVHINYVIPSEGAHMWFDMLAIPKDAPHVEEAHEFINYLMRPDVIAKATNFLFYANGNKESQKFVNHEVLQDPEIYPSGAIMNKLFTVGPIDLKNQKFDQKIWRRIINRE